MVVIPANLIQRHRDDRVPLFPSRQDRSNKRAAKIYQLCGRQLGSHSGPSATGRLRYRGLGLRAKGRIYPLGEPAQRLKGCMAHLIGAIHLMGAGRKRCFYVFQQYAVMDDTISIRCKRCRGPLGTGRGGYTRLFSPVSELPSPSTLRGIRNQPEYQGRSAGCEEPPTSSERGGSRRSWRCRSATLEGLVTWSAVAWQLPHFEPQQSLRWIVVSGA